MRDFIQLKFGFWNNNLDFWKGNSFRYDDARMFDTNILVIDTSTLNPEYYSISAKEKNVIRKHWIKALPVLHNIEYLMTTHQIDQEFFDAICEMKNLKGLYIKWGKVESTAKIKNLKLLEHLYFGSNPRLGSIYGFESLENLKYLEMENFKSYTDYSPLQDLKKLITLKITGTIDKAIRMENLNFLHNLINLRELTLGISLKDKNLKPLQNLKNLEYIWLPTSLEKIYKKEMTEKL